MLKKSVTFDENKNKIRYYEKEKVDYYEEYLTSIYKYMCISTESDDKLYKSESEYTILKSGKKIKKPQ